VLEEFADLDALRLGRALRRTRITAAVLGVLGLVVAPLVGYPVAGLGIAVGLGLGALNTRWADASVARMKHLSDGKAARRPIAARTLGRLGFTTAIVLALLFLVTPMGFGALLGLVLYQAAFLSSMISAVFRGVSHR
jgi:uncharacterized membrane protein